MSAAVPVAAAPSIDLRFAQLIQQFGLTKNSFAVSLGKTASVVQHLIEGRNKPGFDLLCRVFEVYPNVSRDWLLLGRGPMLVGSSASVRPEPAAETTVPEPPLEPIDLTDVAPRVPRRASIGLAGGRLNPADIAATLALATAANDTDLGGVDRNGVLVNAAGYDASDNTPASREPDMLITSAAGVSPAAQPAPAVPAQPATTAAAPDAPATHSISPVAAYSPAPVTSLPPSPVAPALAQPVTSAPDLAPPAAPETPAGALLPAAAAAYAAQVAPAAMPAAAQPGPEVYLTAALHAQQLQHQLALAELRNQHLLEQQNMLREMLAMARQAMV